MLENYLSRQIRHGSLYLHYPGEEAKRLGTGAPEAHWRLNHRDVLRRIASDPEFQLGETYIESQWSAGPGGLLPLLEVLMRNFPQTSGGRLRTALRSLLTPLHTFNRITRSRRNVAHHYDLPEWLFRRFLDPDLHYSCAYFSSHRMKLAAAQQAKCDLIARKLLLKPGHHVLDIGSGWGGLALKLAREFDVKVTGLTLSKEQWRVARQRAEEQRLQHQVEFLLADYRQHHRRYDRIVSVGMFEHVGHPFYHRFFQRLRELLKPDGIALLHTIGDTRSSTSTNPWIRRHIFPGGYIPTLSQVTPAVEAAGLTMTDIEILRRHYAQTLAAWSRRFEACRAEAAERLGERFCRTWEFYLAACEAAFRWRGLVVFQLQLAAEAAEVPITRDYLLSPVPTAPPTMPAP